MPERPPTRAPSTVASFATLVAPRKWRLPILIEESAKAGRPDRTARARTSGRIRRNIDGLPDCNECDEQSRSELQDHDVAVPSRAGNEARKGWLSSGS